MVSTICLLILLSVAVVTDVRWQTIGNWTVYPGMGLALALSVLVTLAGRDMVQGTAWDVRWWGTPDIWSALAGFLSCGFIMLVGYVFFAGGLGGGDVKLLAMVGAFLGFRQGLEALLWTFVLGGAFAVTTLIWQAGMFQLAIQLGSRLKSMLIARCWLPLTDEERGPLQVRLYLSPAALIAVLIVRFEVLALL
ncbi:MAG: A24 family peptidase [Planctomycetota bacterium]